MYKPYQSKSIFHFFQDEDWPDEEIFEAYMYAMSYQDAGTDLKSARVTEEFEQINQNKEPNETLGACRELRECDLQMTDKNPGFRDCGNNITETVVKNGESSTDKECKSVDSGVAGEQNRSSETAAQIPEKKMQRTADTSKDIITSVEKCHDLKGCAPEEFEEAIAKSAGKSSSTKESWDNEDSLPLAKLRDQLSYEERSDDFLPMLTDSEDSDEDYCPKKTKRGKKRAKQSSKNPKKARRSLSKHFFPKKIPKGNAVSLKNVKRQSMMKANVKETIRRHHQQRLDNLLASNELRRVPIAADGDCFFASVITSLGLDKSAQDLRDKVCNHISQNFDNYVSFIPEIDSSPVETKQALFGLACAELQKGGSWKVSLADCLPLAIANLYSCSVLIFSSDSQCPIYDIKPDLCKEVLQMVIKIAYTAVAGEEHYDGVMPCTKARCDVPQIPSPRRDIEDEPSTSTEPSNAIDMMEVNMDNNENVPPSTEAEYVPQIPSPRRDIEDEPSTSTEPSNAIDMMQVNTDNNENVPPSTEAEYVPQIPSPRRDIEDEPSTSTEPSNVIDMLEVNTDNNKECTENINEVTPHKRATYVTPLKKVSTRKKVRREETWKRNVRKLQRSKGETYVSCKGNTVKEKCVQAIDCSNCRFKCTIKISEDDRKKIFESYYKLASYERQRDFVCQMITSVTPVRSSGKKKISHQYYLPLGETRQRVCRDFFVKTLNISNKLIQYNMHKKQNGSRVGVDGRGRQASGNKTKEEILQGVRNHIDSFPKMESHYSRRDSVKEYLAHDLNIKQMWQLYQEQCKQKGINGVKEAKYRQVFCQEYNLSFFKPKKDKCSLCELYESKKGSDPPDEELAKRYKNHQDRKEEGRQEKKKDKERAKADRNYYAATFDLQAVLTTPCSLVGELYYSRKLCCYNLSIYSLGDSKVVCHMWDETQGRRGSCEIATCLMTNIKSLCASNPGMQEITYFSDTCGGQNRNQFVAASMLYSLTKNPSLKRLNHKFLEPGHSQMECDSVHATIETAKRKTVVYVPSQWHTVVSMARRRNPYLVVPMKHDDVMDLKAFVKMYCPNVKVSSSGERINWLQVRWIQVRQEEPKSIFVNYTFSEDTFIEIKVQGITRKRGASQSWPDSLQPCYEGKLPITSAKKTDLVKLCEKNIIPEDFHSYYKSLPTTLRGKDRVPLPASDESEQDTDDE
jgi:hypothetical protein